MLRELLGWLKKNKDWLFSGIGMGVVKWIIVFIVALGAFVLKVCHDKGKWTPQDLGVHKIFDVKTGEIGYVIDPGLSIEKISYPLKNGCSVYLHIPQPVEISRLPVRFDEEEKVWKICTHKLVESDDFIPSKLVHVPQQIDLCISGLKDNDSVKVHIFTDHQYPLDVQDTIIQGKVNVSVNVGVTGFLGYLDLSDPDNPRMPNKPEKNMIASNLGPIAVLIISAKNESEYPRRSKPYVLIRSGVRTPDDVWIMNGRAQWAYVKKELPPLIVFQSTIKCEPPPLQGIFASSLDGKEIYQISPGTDCQNTLTRVEPGPPAVVYFRSNFKTLSTRVCYSVVLNGGPISPPIRVNEKLCDKIK